MSEPIKTEKRNLDNEISLAQVMDKIEKAIESDKDLRFGWFFDFHETTRADNHCSRTFRAVVEMRAIIPVRS